MINKVSKSEVFDIYSRRMISKRASEMGLLGSATRRALEEVLGFVKEIAPELGIEVKNVSALGSEALPVLSRMTESKYSTLIQKILKVSELKNKKAIEEIVTMAEKSGYAGSFDDIASDFARELKAMVKDKISLTESSAEPTAEDLKAFFVKHKKSITFLSELKKSEETGGVLSGINLNARPNIEPNSGGGRAKTTNSQEGKDGLATAVKAIGVVGSLFQFVVPVGATLGAYKLYNSFMNSSDSKSELKESLENAIECLSEIHLKPGSPVVQEQINLSNNLQALLALRDSPNSPQQFVSLCNTLGGDSATEGSVLKFCNDISLQPSCLDTSFFSKETSEGAVAGIVGGGILGGAIGKSVISTITGAAIGAALGGLVGWQIFSTNYSEQINCITSCTDYIKNMLSRINAKINPDSVDASESNKNELGQRHSSIAGITGSYESKLELLARILTVMRTQILGSGIKNIFSDEENIAGSFIDGAGGALNAAKILAGPSEGDIGFNANIKTGLNSVASSDYNSKIDSSFAKKYPDLISAIYGSMQSVKKGIGSHLSPDKVRKYLSTIGFKVTESKNKDNKMKKTSKSINNKELIRKASETKVSYFTDANLGLGDQLSKSYYAGLTGMYNESPTKRTSDYKELYGFQEETGSDLIQTSHPKSVTLVESMGKGGLVENGSEAQQKSIYVATKTPSGNFQSKYAQTVSWLQKLAKAADQQGKKEVSKVIKQTIENLK